MVVFHVGKDPYLYQWSPECRQPIELVDCSCLLTVAEMNLHIITLKSSSSARDDVTTGEQTKYHQ